MPKNENNKKKASWEWRYFYKEEKLKNNVLKLINLNIPKPKYLKYTDQYIIIPKLPHNIKIRKIKNQPQKELNVKTIIKNQNNIFKFSKKSIISFPILEEGLLNLKELNILNKKNKIKSLESIKDIFNLVNYDYSSCFVKKNIIRYNVKKNTSKLKKDIRLEFANIYINNIPFKTISLKCTSITIIMELLKKLDMLHLEGTNYVNYIKSLEK